MKAATLSLKTQDALAGEGEDAQQMANTWLAV